MGEGIWIFGYGSLMWNPGFTPVESRRAVLDGFRRSFCLRSMRYRGTAQTPGLVLGLEKIEGQSCWGLAMRIPCEETEAVMVELRDREMFTAAYLESRVTLRTKEGAAIQAITYVMDVGHFQYCKVPFEAQAQIIAKASGKRGENRIYLEETVAKLRELEMPDLELERLAVRVNQIRCLG